MATTIMSWNLKRGGKDHAAIVDVVERISPDTAVLTEYRRPLGKRGDIRALFEKRGWYTVTTNPPFNEDGILIASKRQMTPGELQAPIISKHRFVHVLHPEGWHLCGVHAPPPIGAVQYSARRYWKRLVAVGAGLAREAAVMLGDFNSGRWALDIERGLLPFSRSFEKLLSFGFRDAFRLQHGFERAWTHWTFGGRIGVLADHILVSASVAPRVVSSELLYEIDGQRLAGRDGDGALSDHAAVLATLH